MLSNDIHFRLDPASLADPVLHPQPILVAFLAVLMLVTFWIGLVHAIDRDEDPSVRWTSGALAVLSLGALIASVHSGIAA